MSTFKKAAAVLLIVLAAITSVVQNVVLAPDGIDNLVDIAAAADGKTLVAQVQDGDVVIDLINDRGISGKQLKLPQQKKGEVTSIADLVIDDTDRVYLIRDYMDAQTGRFLRQELEIYDMSRQFPKKLSVHSLENEENIRYRWMSLSTVVVLMGTNPNETTLSRMAVEAEAAASGLALTAKSVRTYQIDSKEGIYEAVPTAANVAYVTKSGKVFRAQEGMPAQEIYPARVLQKLMYPMFLVPVDGEHVMIGEQESGDICILDMNTGSTKVQMAGTDRFTGVSDYAAQDILKIAARDTRNYTAVVRNQTTGMYDLLVNQDDSFRVISNIRQGILNQLISILIDFLLAALALALIWLFLYAVVKQVRESHTILLKLAFAAIPLLILAFALFGVFSYRFYSDSVEGSFRKQVEDEGNLLTALFGTQSFDEIEFPYDYTSEAYSYLSQQMSTRKVYTRTAYYENNRLFTGVDNQLPCFYSFDMVMNSQLIRLYQEAAFTGFAQTGVISDGQGERITCVTPIGGVDGSTVYLLETGISTAQMKAYTGSYLWRFVLVAAAFILVIGTLLMLVFTRVLGPLRQIQTVLEAFTKGDRKARMASETQDELSDIAKVFNNMANDIDVQIYNLKALSDTYYRFVPQRAFALMGKENLGELNLETHIEGSFNVLSAELMLNPEWMHQGIERDLINRFFNIVNDAADDYQAALVADSSNLCRLLLICPEDGDPGVNIALSILAHVDGYNASVGLQNRLDVMFLLHRTEVYYGICGDQSRYIPTMISHDMLAMEPRAKAEQMQTLRQLSSRLIVTEPAYKTIEKDNYFNRFIGKMEVSKSEEIGLYDFYDESAPEVIRLINNTRSAFDKAMDLYMQGRYYDAKNLFAVVLRENQYDNVARYYIFKCEKKI